MFRFFEVDMMRRMFRGRTLGVLVGMIAAAWVGVGPVQRVFAADGEGVRPEGAAEEVLSSASTYEKGSDLSVLSVQSRPEGARVFVDGEERGETPVYVHDLGDGTHEVILYMKGFGAHRQRIEGAGGRIFVDLESEQGLGVGLVAVTTTPPDARVDVDGQRVGLTPLELPLDAGTHTLHFVKEGFKPAERTVEVVSGGRQAVEATLAPKEGALLVITNPGGGTVLVDDVVVGRADGPTRFEDVAPGVHGVEVRLDGYRSWFKKDVKVPSGRTATVLAALLPLRDYSMVRVFTEPVGAEVWLDGESLGVTAEDGLGFKAPKGAHALRLAVDPIRNPGYLSLEVTVNLSEDEVDFREKPFRLPPVDENYTSGMKLMERGQLEEAMEFLARVAPDHPSYGEARLQIVALLSEVGRIDEIPGELGKLLERPDQRNNPVLNTAMGYWCLAAGRDLAEAEGVPVLKQGLEALERATRTPELFPPDLRDALTLKAHYYLGLVSEFLYQATGEAKFVKKGVQAWDVFFARLEVSPGALEKTWVEKAERHRRNLEFLAKKLAG